LIVFSSLSQEISVLSKLGIGRLCLRYLGLKPPFPEVLVYSLSIRMNILLFIVRIGGSIYAIINKKGGK